MDELEAFLKGGFLTYNHMRNSKWTSTWSAASYIRHGGRMNGTRFFRLTEGDVLVEVTRQSFEREAGVFDA